VAVTETVPGFVTVTVQVACPVVIVVVELAHAVTPAVPPTVQATVPVGAPSGAEPDTVSVNVTEVPGVTVAPLAELVTELVAGASGVWVRVK
jgi:hypothetical protein